MDYYLFDALFCCSHKAYTMRNEHQKFMHYIFLTSPSTDIIYHQEIIKQEQPQII